MKILVTAQQMRKIEDNIIKEFGLPAVVLMERAALCTAERVMALLGENRRQKPILIACGMGNNGADGMALARILAEKGYNVSFVTAGDRAKATELNRLQYHCLQMLCSEGKMREITQKELARVTNEAPGEYAIIIDAVLGIGVSRPITGIFEELILLLNRLSGYKLAMDMPTGIHTDTGELLGTCFRADETICFGAVKTGVCLGEGKAAAGSVLCDSCGMLYDRKTDIGQAGMTDADGDIGQTMFSVTKEDMHTWLQRKSNGNKGSFGKLGMIVGSRNVPGAAILSSAAAYRSGAGYIRVMTHAQNRNLLMERMPEAVLALYTEPEEVLAASADKNVSLSSLVDFADILAVGCGIGTGETQKNILEKLFDTLQKQTSEKILILDADALTILAQDAGLLQKLKMLPCIKILTPHMKEFERLIGIPVSEIAKDRIRTAQAFAREYGVILVLKDAGTLVADGDGRCMINRLGNDGMAVAGSGDVLCGIIASLLGQNRMRIHDSRDAFLCTCAAVTLHAVVGDACRSELGAHGMLPQDMIEHLPGVICEMTEKDTAVKQAK